MSKNRHIKFSIFFFIACLILVNQSVLADSIKFGVQAPRGNATAMKKWSELGKYLEVKIGQKVEIIPLKPNKTVAAVDAGKVHFMLSNPAIAVMLQTKNKSIPIATLNKKSGNQFAGVIISKKGSGIQNADDLKGKRVMAYKFKKSAAAYIFQVKHLKDKGIDISNFSEFKEAKKQDDIVMAVKVGATDVGFIRTGLLESMKKEGKISFDDFIIVDKVKDDFPQIHSTILYPEWTVTAASSVDKATKEKVASALFNISKDEPVSKKANILGFIKPNSLDALISTLKDLKLAPFN